MTPETTVSQRDAALHLMETELRAGRPLAPEYPLVFDADAVGHIETVEAEGQVVSTCAWLPRTLVTPSADLPVALIGSVATKRAERAKGHGTRVLEQATAAAARSGAAVSLLWADDPAWYQERGWVPFGSETVYVIEQANALLLPDPVDVRPMLPGDAKGIHALYGTHASRTARTEAETEAMLRVPNMHVYVCERDGRIEGYACMGRGEDLAQVIHEWGGAPDAVLPCVSRIWSKARNQHDRIYMMVPMSEADYQAYFQFVKAEGAQGILAMAKLGSTTAMQRTIDAATPEHVTVTAAGADAIDITGPAGTIRLTGYEILLAICPPRGDRRVTDVVETQTGATLPGLPLQLFVWGLDSI